jgi:hypothetical protein
MLVISFKSANWIKVFVALSNEKNSEGYFDVPSSIDFEITLVLDSEEYTIVGSWFSSRVPLELFR